MAWWSELTLTGTLIPLVGAALGMIFWSRPSLYKAWGILVIITTWLIVAIPSWISETPLTLSFFLMHLIIAAGVLTILGQPPTNEAPSSLCLLLLLTALGLGFVANHGYGSSFFLCGLLGVLILALVSQRKRGREISWSAVGIMVLGLISVLLSGLASGPLRILAQLVPLGIVWPLLPVHGAFVASVRSLPGTLPAFVAVLLPSLGFHGIVNLLPIMTEEALIVLWIVAIASALYGSLLALCQDSMDSLLAYAHMSLGAILWWYVAVTHSVGSGAVVFLAGLSLVVCGLLLTTHYIGIRFGRLDLNIHHGLAHIMPCCATLFVLFITAALGLPFFTLFSAFMEMMLDISSTPVGSTVMILLAWLMASWYFPRFMQQVLFGPSSSQCRAGKDLQVYETFSLVLLLALLILLGMTPSHWFGVGDTAVPVVQLSFETLQASLWNL